MTTSEQLNRMAEIIKAQEEIAYFNDAIDRYAAGALVKIYAANGIHVSKDGKISGRNILRAAEIYNKCVREIFTPRGADIMEDMHARGFDVRMDMQSYKLVWKGVYKND